MKRVAVIVAGILVLLVVLFGGFHGFYALREQTAKAEVAVTLAPAADGCTPQITDVIGGGFLKQVKWLVTNNCSTSQVVTMRDFVEDAGGQKSTNHVQIFSDDPVDSGPINSGARDHPVPTRVTKFVIVKTLFHYTLCTRDQATQASKCLDPDVEIWP